MNNFLTQKEIEEKNPSDKLRTKNLSTYKDNRKKTLKLNTQLHMDVCRNELDRKSLNLIKKLGEENLGHQMKNSIVPHKRTN